MIFPRRLGLICPYCRYRSGKSLCQIRLGPGTRPCPPCHRIFADHSIEWPVATTNQKFQHLFPEIAVVYLMGNALFAILPILSPGSNPGDHFEVAILFAALAFVPLLLRLCIRWFRVRQSIDRYQKALLIKSGYNARVITEMPAK
jgi:hypothetical protein